MERQTRLLYFRGRQTYTFVSSVLRGASEESPRVLKDRNYPFH